MNRLRWRKGVNAFWTVASGAAVLAAVIPLASLLWLVVSHGVGGLSLGFFTSLPTPVGEPGAAHVRMAEPAAHSTAENTRACRSDSSPRAVGRQAVRRILASMLFSTRQLKAAAAPATSQMPALAMAMRASAAPLGRPGTASTMPMSAQNTMSWTTRGLVSA